MAVLASSKCIMADGLGQIKYDGSASHCGFVGGVGPQRARISLVAAHAVFTSGLQRGKSKAVQQSCLENRMFLGTVPEYKWMSPSRSKAAFQGSCWGYADRRPV